MPALREHPALHRFHAFGIVRNFMLCRGAEVPWAISALLARNACIDDAAS